MTEARISLEVDNAAQAAYIRVGEGAVAHTAQLTDGVLIDLDEMNIVVGVEVLELAAEIPFSRLRNEYHVHSDVIDLLRIIQPSVRGFLLTQASDGVTDAAPLLEGANVPSS